MEISAFNIVSNELKEVERFIALNLYSNEYLITKVSKYILKSGGKRFRPALLLLCAKLCGYNNGNRHINMASAIELIHTATLLHDDVVDNADLRRGNTSANILWGNELSVLVGDYILTKAFTIIHNDNDQKIMDYLSKVIPQMVESEAFQFKKRKDIKTTEKDYLRVISGKTAMLISASCRIGAILGNASKKKEQDIADFGLNLGMAFQIIDDCLDYTLKRSEWGKSTVNDLKEGRLTIPIIYALKNCNKKERHEIENILYLKDIKAGNINKVKHLINKYKGIEYSREKADSYISHAKRLLKNFNPSPVRESLIQISNYVVNRVN